MQSPNQPGGPVGPPGSNTYIDQQAIQSTISDSLNRANGVANVLLGKASNGIINDIANATVSTDMLATKPVQQIQSTLGNAAQTLMQLQAPIQNSLMTDISQSVGNTQQLGVIPPMPDTASQDPICVTIAKEASLGQIGTALAYFTQNVLPHANPPDAQYYAGRNFLDSCLANYPTLVDNLAQAITQLISQSLSGAVSRSTVTVPNTPTQGQLLNPPPSNPQFPPSPINWPIFPPVQPGSVPFPTQYPAYPAGGPHPWTFGNGIPGTNPDGVTACPPASVCGLGWQMYNAVFDSYGPPPGYCGPMTITGADGRVVNTIPGDCSSSPTTTSPGGVPTPPVHTPTATPCPPPTVTCPAPVVNVTVPSPQPQKPCPKTPECPPGQLYDPNTGECVDKPTPPKYCVYCGSGGMLYIVKQDQPPISAGDTLLACGSPDELDWTSINDSCKSPDTPTPAGGATPEVPAVPPIDFGEILGCTEFGSIPQFEGRDIAGSVLQFLGLVSADGSPIIPFPDASPLNVPANLANALVGLLETLLSNPLNSIGGLLANTPCGGGKQLGLLFTRAGVGFLEQYLGINLDVLRTPVDQKRHFLCPLDLPSYSEAASAFLGDAIDEATLECWARADNKRYPEFKRVVDSMRSKYSPDFMARAVRRGFVAKNDFNEYVRQSGYLRDFEPQLAYDMSAALPNPSDLISLMVKDAADNVNIDWQKEDAEFPNKYTGKIKEWGEQNGVQEDFMQMYWRAHYSIPSPTQLYQMLHRLSRLPVGDPAYVDSNTVKQALQQQDISPKWVDKLMAISYSPLTRIDARRAFEIGSLDDTGLKNAYLDLGYTDDAANQLVSFNKKNITRSFYRKPYVNDFANGYLTDDAFSRLAMQDGANSDILDSMRARAELLTSRNTTKACVKATRQRFLMHDLTFTESIAAVVSYGIPNDRAAILVTGWNCERNAKGKELTSADILSLYKDGIINEATAFDRLQSAGWSPDDAVLKIRQAAKAIQKKIDQSLLAQQRADANAQAKLARQIAQQQNAAARAASKLAAQAERLQKLRELREKRLLEAAKNVSEHTGMSYSDSVFAVKQLHHSIIGNAGATIDESIQTIGVVSSDAKITTWDQIIQAVSAGVSALVGS